MTTAAELFSSPAMYRALTVDDLPTDPDGVRFELIEGGLHVTPSADFDHQLLADAIVAALRPHLPPGLRTLQAPNVVQGAVTLLIPDIAVVDTREVAARALGAEPRAVRLIVEITSSSTRLRDLTIKRELYRQWGVPYVIVDRGTTPYSVVADGAIPDFAAGIADVVREINESA